MKDLECDNVSGICSSQAPAAHPPAPFSAAQGMETVYVGDPMCSWCWGIAPALQRLQRYCHERRLRFRVVVGGLRPGGGDPWDHRFREFLRHHWREVAARTGQPFHEDLLERPAFEYDTEPACRAVVAARPLIAGSELPFFAAVQRRFYVDNEDPKRLGFYREVCAGLDLDFDLFAHRFEDDDVKRQTLEEFQLNRSWGVSGYPTILAQIDGRRTPVATGFATFEQLRERLERALPQPGH